MVLSREGVIFLVSLGLFQERYETPSKPLLRFQKMYALILEMYNRLEVSVTYLKIRKIFFFIAVKRTKENPFPFLCLIYTQEHST